jgi:protein SCO1/2
MPGGPFALVDHTGRAVTHEDFRGKHLLVFFGYTYCPDFCPTTLHVISATLDLLGGGAREVTPLFITIDPERDTPEVLADYVAMFHPSTVGLTGAPKQVRMAADAYQVFFAKAHSSHEHEGGAEADYLMDHSAFTFFMGPDGKYLTHFAYDTSPQKMAENIRRYIGPRS